MITLTKSVAFTTESYNEIDEIQITLNEGEINKISEVAEIVRQNNLNYASLSVGGIKLLTCEGESNFKCNPPEVRVYNAGITIFITGKYTCGVQYESKYTLLNELNK